MKAKRIGNIFFTLWMAVAIFAMPYSTALATGQTATDVPPDGARFGMAPVNTAALTEAQLQAYETAKAAYEQAEDEALASLVTAGVLTAEEVQAYQTMRAQIGQMAPQGQPPQGFPQGGTPPQGEPPQVQLPQGQGNPNGGLPPQGGSIWGVLSENAADEAVQAATDALTQADAAYRAALDEAGIALPEQSRGQPPQGTV